MTDFTEINRKKESFNPEHGGNLQAASDFYKVPLSDWIDLSTGMNPDHYPVSALPSNAFTELPYLKSEFLYSVSRYYGCDQFLPVAGSQAVIQLLPQLLPNLPVLLPEVGYQEHAKHWSRLGEVRRYPSLTLDVQISFIDQALEEQAQQHLVIINPNNPTGALVKLNKLREWASKMSNGAYLIVDEAFIDLTPEQSVLTQHLPDNLIVLRSFGKFFGLAGLRLGFVFAHSDILKAMNNALGLWQINGPAQALANTALLDERWHRQALQSIQQLNEKLNAWLIPLGAIEGADCLYDRGLFVTWSLPKADARKLMDYLGNKGVLIRYIELNESRALVRFGLPNESQLQRLNSISLNI